MTSRSPRPVAIVTGSESGIGRATAVALAQHGFDVGITWHADRGEGQRTADEATQAGARTDVAQLDLADAAGAAQVLDVLAERLGGVDVLVNCAAAGHSTPFLELDLETWQRVLDVNLTGTFAVAQAAARRMVAGGKGGRIVNVTSVHEHVALDQAAAYCASKGGVGLLTKVMALELAQHGIAVNAVAPGEIATGFTGAADVDPHTRPRPGIPFGRPGDAREVAAAIAFLAGGESGYVTGHSFVVDGGLLLMAAEANRRLA
jgi:NAD(P)-dependent dehydrogenase (short-subunit alcohol dehydrogenase family)